MAKLKSGTRIYGTATVDTSVAVGSAVTLSSSGVQVSGASTLGTVQISSGIVTATTGIVTYYGDGSKLTGVVASSATYATSSGIATYATSSGIATYATTAGVSTSVIGGIASVTQLNVSSGVSTFSGITTHTASLFGTQASFTGVVTASSFSGSGANLTNISVSSAGYATTAGIATYATTAGVSTSVIGGIGSITQLQVTGISTFSNGPVLVGAATSTGTLNQRLQVTGGASFIGVGASVGIGTTNPLYPLTVTSSSATATPNLNNVIADFTANTDSFSQINTRNASASANASTDIIATANNGTDTTNYIDLGINNSGFSVGGWTINGALDGYLYTSDTNLSIGAAAANKYVSIFAGGTLAANEVSRFNSTGVGIGTTNPRSTLQVGTAITMYGTTGIVSATSFYGSGSNLTGLVPNTVTLSSATTPQFIGFSTTSSGVTTSISASSTLTYIPSSGNLGIGTTNPQQTLHVQGNVRITGSITDSTGSTGSSPQVLQSTTGGTVWTTISSSGAVSGTKFDTTIDNSLYVQATGTLDIVGVGTTTTQLTTFPAGSNEYVIHSMHVTNVSNGDAEITAGFVMSGRKVPATITVGGGAGINTITVGSASSIVVGMAVTGQGNATNFGTGLQYNTYVTSVDGNNITLSKPIAASAVSGVLYFSSVSKVASRLPVPVGSAVELLKQPMVLNALDSIVLQSTGAGSGIGSTSTSAITQAANSNILTVTAGAAITNFLSSGMLIQPTGGNTGIQTNTFVGVGYTPGALLIPMTKPATVALASTSLSFTEVVVPQDGALQVTVVYQSSTDTSYQNGTGTVVGIVTLASQASSRELGITSTTPSVYYGTGAVYPSIIQSIRVSNISDGIIYPGGDYPVSVGIGNSDTIFSWLAYNMVIPKNSSIELCEAPKRIGIGQSIFAFSNTPNAIEIQIAGKQKI